MKLPNVVLHENPCSGSPVVTSSSRIQKQDIAYPMIAFFWNFVASAPQKSKLKKDQV
jgi:hypothetical protein